MSAHSRPNGELSLLEMLADPIISSEMVRDGATSADLDSPTGTVWREFAGKWTTNGMESSCYPTPRDSTSDGKCRGA